MRNVRIKSRNDRASTSGYVSEFMSTFSSLNIITIYLPGEKVELYFPMILMLLTRMINFPSKARDN